MCRSDRIFDRGMILYAYSHLALLPNIKVICRMMPSSNSEANVSNTAITPLRASALRSGLANSSYFIPRIYIYMCFFVTIFGAVTFSGPSPCQEPTDPDRGLICWPYSWKYFSYLFFFCTCWLLFYAHRFSLSAFYLPDKMDNGLWTCGTTVCLYPRFVYVP